MKGRENTHGQKEHLSFGKCTIIFFNSAEKFEYSPEFESVIIDTGNETRKPQIQIVTTGTNNLIKTYQGCSTKHQYTDDMGLQWTYQVARFKFVNTVKIGNPVYIGGTEALSLEGENIVVNEKGSFEVDINSSTSLQSASFVGGFVPKIGYSGMYDIPVLNARFWSHCKREFPSKKLFST